MPAASAWRYSPSTAVTERPASPTRLPAWQALQTHARRLDGGAIGTLFAQDATRADRYALRHDGLYADFSKQLIDDAVHAALLELAEQTGLAGGIESLFAGEPLNFTEDRPALHMALRGGAAVPTADAAELAEGETRMRAFVRALRDGTLRGAHGDPIRDVVNLGIGGSDLGPRLVCEALAPHGDATPRVHFVANIDPAELDEVLARCAAGSTLFILSSKSFTTLETLANARAARDWLHAGLGPHADVGAHFAAVSNRVHEAGEFGIAPERVFPVPEWVGGRFSLWSAIGLPVRIALGEDGFDALLAGARSIDEHFRHAPAADNLPVMLALAGIWNTNFLGIGDHAVLPYAHGLRSFPAWLQQLEMESNGKRCLWNGGTAEAHTAPVVFGHAGTVSQHAVHQLFYQGTRRVAIDFIVPVSTQDARARAMYQNALAQAEALMTGLDLATAHATLRARGLDEAGAARLAPHLVCPGNQPSTTLLLPGLTPRTLGQLLALYEHKTFVQGWIWGINSFDQYGVELGKALARQLAGSPGEADRHPSTAALLAAIARMTR